MNNFPDHYRDEEPLPPPPRPVPVKLNLTAPRLTYAIIVMTALVYLAQVGTHALTGYDLPAALGAKSNALIRAGQLWRLFTPALLHGSLIHIGVNMYALFVIGPGLERRYGYVRFLLVYILAAFSGNVFSFLLTRQPSLGASTAIFGLFAAEGVFVWQNRQLLRGARRELGNLLQVLVLNLGLGLLVPGIDMWGHVGGLLGGLIFAWFAGPQWELSPSLLAPEVIDRRGLSNTLVGVGVVILIFGLLTAFGILYSLV